MIERLLILIFFLYFSRIFFKVPYLFWLYNPDLLIHIFGVPTHVPDPRKSYFSRLIFSILILVQGRCELQGNNAIFKGLKMTFRTKILKKKLYHVNQHQKYYKLCFDNFSLRPLFIFDRALDHGQAHF